MTSRGLAASIAAAGLASLASACNGTGTGSTNGGGETGGSTTGAFEPITITPTKGLQFNAGFSGSYGPIALAAAAGEGEFFFSEAGDAGSTYILQHLTPGGKAVAGGVEVAKGTPTAPPKLAVSSDGKEIACCWEDWGHLDPAAGTAGQVTRCNSVPVTGVATDAAMDGGFGDVGSNPSIAQGPSATALVYVQNDDNFVSEALLYQWTESSLTFIAPYVVPQPEIVPARTGFTLFISDGGAIELSQQAHNLYNDGGLQLVPGAAAGSFAVATNAIPATPAVMAVLVHQGSQVVTTLLGTASPTAITLSSATEEPLDSLAAVACNSGTFGFAYALDGGDVGLREIGADGTLMGTGVLVPSFGANVTSVALAAIDGGLLIGAGNSDNVAVYAAPCP